MTPSWKSNHALFLVIIGALAWLLPGAGHFALQERKRGLIIFVMILLMFVAGLYVGSIGVIDPVNAKPWFAAQVMNSPTVLFLGNHVADTYRRAKQAEQRAAYGGQGQTRMISAYAVYGRAGEIGQIYTSIAGLLNLLCIVNAIYVAHLRSLGEAEA